MRKYPLIFFFIAFFGNYFFFFSRPLRGRFLTFFPLVGKKRWKNWKSLKNLKKKKKKCGKFGFLKAMRAGSWDRLFFFFGLRVFLVQGHCVCQCTSNSTRNFDSHLTGGNWQKWKRVFLTCPCHEIYRDEAVGLKSCKNTWKLTIFVKMWNLGQYRENLIFCQ